MNDLLKLLGKRIHELRASKQWSQEEFAHVSGLHRTYIGQIERGEKNISFDNLARVAGTLGVNLSALLEGLEDGAAGKLPRAEDDIRKESPHLPLETRKLVRRLKLQQAEMSQTILALESLPARANRPNAGRKRTIKVK